MRRVRNPLHECRNTIYIQSVLVVTKECALALCPCHFSPIFKGINRQVLPVSAGQVKVPSSPTNVRVLALRRVLRDPPVRKAGLVRPVIRILGLPRPLNPALAFLVRDRLRLPVLPEERLVARAERRRVARETRARADAGRSRVGAVVTRADAAAVEISGAVRRGRSPLADERPEVERGKRGAIRAGGIDVLLIRAADLL